MSGISAVLSEERQALSEVSSPAASDTAAAAAPAVAGSRRVVFNVAVDGEDRGRIVVQLFDDVLVGAARFADLAQGKQGVGFQRTKFDAINEVCFGLRPWLLVGVACRSVAALFLKLHPHSVRRR